MALDEAQKATIARWLSEGDSLSQIQSKLKSELSISMTFMEVRFLIDDLDLELKKEDPAPVKEEETKGNTPLDEVQNGVTVDVDSLITPGALASGSVSFSDGTNAKWQLDQMGRLGLTGVDEGYQPPPEDMQDFQLQLQEALKAKGFA